MDYVLIMQEKGFLQWINLVGTNWPKDQVKQQGKQKSCAPIGCNGKNPTSSMLHIFKQIMGVELTHYKIYPIFYSMIFSKFIGLWNHQHDPVLEPFYIPKIVPSDCLQSVCGPTWSHRQKLICFYLYKFAFSGYFI